LKNVLIVQRRLTHYRVPLFEALRNELRTRDIQLDLLVGQGTPEEMKKRDAGELCWAVRIPTRYFAAGRLCWQPVHRYLAQSNLVIVAQENKLLHNYLLLLRPRRFQLAFWGHGANLQSNDPHGLKERFKRWTTRRVDWWFAYTKMSAEFVTRAGFPPNRITVLNNAIDTSELRRQRESVTAAETLALRHSLGFRDGPVGVFVGSLYTVKRLDFLFAAAKAIRREVADFHLLVIGEGPERDKVRTWCDAHPWARWVGARYGREKAAHLSVAQVTLNPGLVGLGILDSFACGVPMITTDCGIHSPEIAYLENERNGVMTPNTVAEYVGAAVRLLHDRNALNNLRADCSRCSTEYTVENMVRSFSEGINQCLSSG
jgi:glycosyltransferase involved in cell wall biosynthesis